MLVDRHDGKRLNAPNDVAVKSDGTIWFTDPLYGIQSDYEGGRQISEQPPALYRFDPASAQITVACSDFDGPNGLAFSPDEKRLYVAETGDQTTDDPKQYIRVFESDPTDPDRRQNFHKVEPGYADGLCVDEDGNVWASAADGVHCIDPERKIAGQGPCPASRIKFDLWRHSTRTGSLSAARKRCMRFFSIAAVHNGHDAG